MHEFIKIQNSNQVPKLIIDYLNNTLQTRTFHSFENTTEGFAKKITTRTFSNEKRKLLVERIEHQYQQNNITPPKILPLLLKENTFTVTTGHQLALLGNPKFFIHKIASTIKLSQQLKLKFPKYNFIPVFWLASEDHDFEEISTVNIFNQTLKATTHFKGAVGKMPNTIFKAIYKELYNSIITKEDEIQLLSSFFNPNAPQRSLTQETRYWVNQLFKEYNLVIIDGDDHHLKQSAQSIFKQEIIANTSFTTISSTNKKLTQLGYKTQVNPREINLFYMDNNLRERIIKKENRYHILNTDLSFSQQELLSEIEQHPEHFSPNVVLRPVYQEHILPNITYIGGPGELSYWLQLKETFSAFSTGFPILTLRDFYLFVKQRDLNTLQKFNLELSDLFLTEDALIKQYLLKSKKPPLSLNDEYRDLENIKTNITQKIETITPSLKQSVEAEFSKFYKALNKIEKKTTRTLKQTEENNLSKLKKIQQRLLPNGKLAERSESFISDFLTLKNDYVKTLILNSDTFNTDIKVIKQ